MAVGLAGLGMQVVATDASEAMVRRTAELSEEFGASVRAVRASWEELPDHFEDGTFEVFGVPVAYIPYFYYPDPTVKRRSGLLAPEFSNSDDLGFAADRMPRAPHRARRSRSPRRAPR